MGLLANGFRDQSGVYQIWGAGVQNNAYPSQLHRQFARTGAIRNLTAGDGMPTDNVGYPSGNLHPNSWMLPQKAGLIASRNKAVGVGALSLELVSGVNAEASLTGDGTISSAVAQLVISMVAALSGSGTISNAAAQAFLALAAELAGDGDLAGTATAIGHAAAALSGAGDVSSTATALGTLAAAITVTGDLLTTATIGDAVWAVLIEAGLTAKQAMRIIAAATAGKVSGAETSTITIRNAVGDDTDRIIATTDADGNRTAITYDLD